MANARLIAVKALEIQQKDEAFSNILLNNMLKSAELSAQDKAFATAIFYGVLDRKITLDYLLNSLTKTPFSKVDSFTANVLRSALYQIMYMDRVPDSAAVNEAVKLIKNSRQKNKSGFVNAVLRAALRHDTVLPKPEGLKNISIAYSCPEWIAAELIKDYGTKAAVDILEEFLKPSKVYLKVNTTKISAEALQSCAQQENTELEICENGTAVKLLGSIEFESSELYRQGYFHAQDLSSQRAVSWLEPKIGERILDMCAAPGGKSFTLAELSNDSAEIVSCDLYENRTRLIQSGAKRLGLSSIKVKCADATIFDEEAGSFDAVLCDVPCSGLGILRRKPDIKYKGKANFEELEDIQYSILNSAAKYLKSGGRLLYSTCTLRKAENEKQVERFLSEHSDFSLAKVHTFLPHIDLTDGFFAALLIKK